MDVLQASGDGRAGVAAGVHDVFAVVVLGLVEQGLDARLHEAPGTGVERLLLCPNDGLGVGVHVEVLLQLLPGEGVHLLNAGKGNVVELVVGAVLVQGSPDLTSAENNALNLLGSLDRAGLVLRVGDDPLEASVLAAKLLNVGAGERVTQQSLGEEDDERYGALSVLYFFCTCRIAGAVTYVCGTGAASGDAERGRG